MNKCYPCKIVLQGEKFVTGRKIVLAVNARSSMDIKTLPIALCEHLESLNQYFPISRLSLFIV